MRQAIVQRRMRCIIKEFISIVHQNVYETIIFVTFDKIMSQQECLQA